MVVGNRAVIQRSRVAFDIRLEAFLVSVLGIAAMIGWASRGSLGAGALVTVAAILVLVIDHRSASRTARRTEIELIGPTSAVSREPMRFDVLVTRFLRPV